MSSQDSSSNEEARPNNSGSSGNSSSGNPVGKSRDKAPRRMTDRLPPVHAPDDLDDTLGLVERAERAEAQTERQAPRPEEAAVGALVAKYGGEALDALRRSAELVDFIAAVGKLYSKEWSAAADSWRRTLAQTVAQMEDTDLAQTTRPAAKLLTNEDTIAGAIREHLTLLLHVQRKSGERGDIEVEPYSLRRVRGEWTLTCWNREHGHLERIPLHRILYSKGDGIHFEPRYDAYIEDDHALE